MHLVIPVLCCLMNSSLNWWPEDKPWVEKLFMNYPEEWHETSGHKAKLLNFVGKIGFYFFYSYWKVISKAACQHNYPARFTLHGF